MAHCSAQMAFLVVLQCRLGPAVDGQGGPPYSGCTAQWQPPDEGLAFNLSKRRWVRNPQFFLSHDLALLTLPLTQEQPSCASTGHFFLRFTVTSCILLFFCAINQADVQGC